jgi:predicted permease
LRPLHVQFPESRRDQASGGSDISFSRNSLILGSSFGNVTYLGMPLLRGLFPENVLDVTQVAVLSEITVTSTDLIIGTLLAAASQQSGGHVSAKAVLMRLLKFPLLWSVAIASIIRA